MKIPRNQTRVLNFKHNDTWYQITSSFSNGSTQYVIYRQLDKNEYEKLQEMIMKMFYKLK